MSKFTKELINDLADKLLIGLTEDENKLVLEEFESIDENLNLLNKIDGLSNVEPMTHALDDFEYSLREDSIEPSPEIEEILSNCDDKSMREIVVPKVVG